MNKNTSLRSDDKKMVPQGWETVVLADIGMIRSSTVDPSKFPEQTFELWSVPSYPSGKPELLLGSEIGSTKQIVQEGDVLLCKINPRINRVWRVGPKGSYQQIASSEWILFRNSEIDPDFLMHRMKEGAFREKLCADVSGVGGSLTRARPISVKKIEIDVAPNKEQARIVTAIESLQQRSARARALLTEVSPALVNLRQSILQAAFSGRLTADWRAKNPDVEPADQLLARIRTERRQRWEAAELEKYDAKGKKPPKNWKDKYKEPEPVDDSELPELPEGWCWVSAEEACRNVFLGLTAKVDYVDTGGVPLVRAGDISTGYLKFDKARTISVKQHKELTKYRRAKRGDVLVSKSGSLGTCALVDTDREFSIYESTIAMQPNPELLGSIFLLWSMRSPEIQNRMLGRTVGSTVGHLNLKEFRTLALPIAPIKEQDCLVEIVLDSMSKISTTESNSIGMDLAIDHLNQSILSKAFRGELVPQDPNDEPASELLARIRATREKEQAEKKASKKKSSKKKAKKKSSKKRKS